MAPKANKGKGNGGFGTSSIINSGTLKSSLAAINKSGRDMRREANADYNVGLSASAAGQANLRRQFGASSKLLAAGQARATAATNRLADAARGTSRQVAAKQAKTNQLYGSALAGSTAGSFGQANATAAAGERVSKSYAAQSAGMGKMAGQVAALGKQEVTAQGEAAKYALAQALQSRNMVDASTLAQLKGQLYQTALAANLQYETWKKQQDYALKIADKEKNKQLMAAAQALPTEAPPIAGAAWQAGSKAMQDDPENYNVGTMVADWEGKMGYEPGSPQSRLYAATLRNLQSQGTDPSKWNTGSAMNDAITQLYSGTPGWHKSGENILDSTYAGVNTYMNSAAWGSMMSPGGGGSPQGLSAEGVNVNLPQYAGEVATNLQHWWTMPVSFGPIPNPFYEPFNNGQSAVNLGG